MLAVAALTLPACSNDENPSGNEPTPESPPESDAPMESALGTWDNPLPAGDPVEIEGWEVTISDTRLMTEGPDPDMPDMHAPDDGTVHVVVHVQATRTGDEPARIPTMGEGFTLSLVDGGTEVGEGLAITINDPIASGDVGPGATVEGWMLASANVSEGSTEAEGLAVAVKPFIANPEAAYISLPPAS